MINLTELSKIQSKTAIYISTTISSQLKAGNKVLWLVPGGSSIEVAIIAAKSLANNDLSRLTVTLTDERFGDVGHVDSNWKQLLDGGFDLPGARLMPVLIGETMVETVDDYGETITTALRESDFSIGFFGIGADGHTAGILPGSPAVSVSTPTAGYDAKNYQRITITPSIIASLDEAVVYAVGENKWPIIEALGGTMERADWPAMSLKTAGKLTVFTDYPGDTN